MVNIVLLYRRITSIGAITVTLWVGTLARARRHRHRRPALRPSHRVRFSARRVPVLARFLLRARRGCAHRRVRLPRVYGVCYIGDEVGSRAA